MRSWVRILAFTSILFSGRVILAEANFTDCEKTIVEKGLNRGSLFSATILDGPLRLEWERLYPEAVARFPNLTLTNPLDLHMTVFYFGSSWKVESIDKIKALIRFSSEPVNKDSVFRIGKMGENNQVVALNVINFPERWGKAVQSINHKLNELGLKRPDRWDDDFEAHVSLAESKSLKPSEDERNQLNDFVKWTHDQLHLTNLHVQLSPFASILMLANASRTANSTKFIQLDEFVRINCGH